MNTLLTVEGIDCCGKSSVVERLGVRYPDAVLTKEPTDLWTGEHLRESLSDPYVPPLTDFYNFMADRANHIESVIKEADGLVVSDRYADSTRAYQPVALAETEYFDSQIDAKIFIEETMAPWLVEPDQTFYIDVSVDTSMDRMDLEREKYETRENLALVKENYDALTSAKDRITRIDGEQGIERVVDDIQRHL